MQAHGVYSGLCVGGLLDGYQLRCAERVYRYRIESGEEGETPKLPFREYHYEEVVVSMDGGRTHMAFSLFVDGALSVKAAIMGILDMYGHRVQ